MKNHRQWPDDYKDWTGTIEDLVQEAGTVLRQISPQITPPSLSGIRYYQSKGALGRGEKRGRTSCFGFDDLATVVATKQMVKQQLPLSLTRDMLSHTPSDTLMNNAGLGEYDAYGSPAAAATMAMTSSTPGNPAELAVARLLGASSNFSSKFQNPRRAVMSANLAVGEASIIGSTPTYQTPTPAAAALPPGGTLRYSLEGGVAVEIPADSHDRGAQARALRVFADQLDPPHHNHWSIK